MHRAPVRRRAPDRFAPAQRLVRGRRVEPHAGRAEVAHRRDGISPDGPTSRRPAHSAGTTFTRSAASRRAARSTSVAEVEQLAAGVQDSRTQEAVGDGQVDRRLVALQPGEALEVLAFEPRVHAERQREDAEEQPERAHRRNQGCHQRERKQTEQHADLRVPLHDGGVGERLVGRDADDAFLVSDLVLESVNAGRRSQARAPLSRGPARCLNSSSNRRSNLEPSSGFHLVADAVVAEQLDDAVVGGLAPALDVEDPHLVGAHRIRPPVPRAAVQVHTRVTAAARTPAPCRSAPARRSRRRAARPRRARRRSSASASACACRAG